MSLSYFYRTSLLFFLLLALLPAHTFTPKDKASLQNLLQNPRIALSQINTHYIKDMSYLFCLRMPLIRKGICTPYREDFSGIGKWDVSHVENMEGLFMNQVHFNEPLKRWNPVRVKNFSYMFANATHFNQPINNWNTSSGVDFSYMFANATHFNQPINNWNTSSGVDFSYMFYHARSFNQPLDRWNRWNRSSKPPQNFSYMFANASHFKQNISRWKDLKRANIQGIFLGTPMQGLELKDSATPTPPNVLQFLHYPQNKAELIALINDVRIPLASINTSLIEDMSYLFCDKENIYTRLKQLPIKNGGLWEHTDAEYPKILNLYENCHATSARTNLDGIETWDVSHVKNMEGMFMGREINIPLNNWDTGGVTNMKAMFALASFNKPLDDWDTRSVKDTSFMFYGCRNFNQNLDNWNMERVVNLSYMFSLTYNFNGDITRWKLSSATNLQGMFKYATLFNQPIGAWDVSHVENMAYLFYGAFLFNQPLNDWNTSHVISMRKMFFYAKSFNYPLNHWDTTHVLDMYKMFAYTKNFNQDLSTWNLHRADSRCMFLHATGMHSFFPRAFFETSSSCS
ncbi:BspA family leucine-rich repeat surface protein [Helicobacter suis]|uniref:BspA family leucine-rich repeat surface protein n=1 Tax=Helicobacter suis TaxID=104628 RepID=UPI0002F584DE|nr:BspA family leucine-rich repeat surface protein [Helicobacter suis]